jgi:hypothetical protein
MKIFSRIALFGVILVLAVILFSCVLDNRSAKNFDTLIKGNANISKFIINGYYSGKPIQVTLTNQTDLNFLNSAFKKASVNWVAGYHYTGQIWFNDNSSVNVEFNIPENTSGFAISRSSFLTWHDPVEYLIPLSHPMPTNLDDAFHYLADGHLQ